MGVPKCPDDLRALPYLPMPFNTRNLTFNILSRPSLREKAVFDS